MATTSIAIRSKDTSDTTGTTTINYVNPEATSAQLQSLAGAFNDLTTNTIVDVTRIDKQVLGSEVAKLPRNLTVNKTGETASTAATIALANVPTTPSSTLEFEIHIGNGGSAEAIRSLLININQPWSDTTVWPQVGIQIYYAEDSGAFMMCVNPFKSSDSNTPTLAGTVITITSPETDTYAEESVTITLE